MRQRGSKGQRASTTRSTALFFKKAGMNDAEPARALKRSPAKAR